MKKISILLILMGGCLMACSGGSGSSSGAGSATELSLNARTFGAIEAVAEVDWYHYQAVETNNVLEIQCSGETANPTVDFLAAVYEKNDDGDLVRIWGDHAPEDAALPADLVMNIAIDEPKDLYIAVRDYLDDESSPQTRYCLQLAYTREAVDNETFAQATPLGVDDPTACHTDTIGMIGDVDCFTFETTAAGIYSVHTDFDFYNTTPVRLDIKLYDDSGTLVHATSLSQATQFHFSVYLEQGTHYLAVQDQGRDDSDPSATYEVCVTSVTAGEILIDDTFADARAMALDLSFPHPKYDTLASIEYQQDQDWYLVPIPAATGGNFQTMKLTFNDTVPDSLNAHFQISVQDNSGTLIISHEYPNGANGYTVQFRVDPGDMVIGIKPTDATNVPQALEYSLTAEVLTIDDPPENAGDGNDSISTADVLSPPYAAVEGKIGFRGDNDWYRITIDNSVSAQIFSIDFSAQAMSDVEYCLDIMNGGRLKTLSDTSGQNIATQLKTSFYVPVGADPVYFIKAGDCQGDDGADVAYDLIVSTADIAPTPADVPGVINPESKPTFYNSETYERGLLLGDYDTGQAIEVECAIYPQYDPEFITNNQLLKPMVLDTNNQYISDWICGYVDFQGDQDWYVLDIKPLGYYDAGVLQPIPATWYYDIEIHLYSSGSEVEYTWKLYRDRADGATPPNGIVIERTPGTTDILNVDDRDGIMAAWATDLVTGTPSNVDKTVPDGVDDADFWVGDLWQNDHFYLSLSDFNYTRLDSNALNPVPDDDWGYTAPYYFQVKMTFHPNDSDPN